MNMNMFRHLAVGYKYSVSACWTNWKKKSNLFAFRLSNERQGVERSSLFADVLATISPPRSRASIAFTIDRLPLRRSRTSEGCGYKCGRSRKDQCLLTKKSSILGVIGFWYLELRKMTDCGRKVFVDSLRRDLSDAIWWRTGSKDRYRIADQLIIGILFCIHFFSQFEHIECILIVFLSVGWPDGNRINRNTLARTHFAHIQIGSHHLNMSARWPKNGIFSVKSQNRLN